MTAKVSFLCKRKITFFYFLHFSGLRFVFVRLRTTESNKKKVQLRILYLQKYILNCFMGNRKQQQFSLTFILGAIEKIQKITGCRRPFTAKENCLFTKKKTESEVQVFPFRFFAALFCPPALDALCLYRLLILPQGDKHGNKNPLLYISGLMFRGSGSSFLPATKGTTHNDAATQSRADVSLMARKHL